MIGLLDPGLHGTGEGFHIGFPDIGKALGEAREHAGEDDAGVAPGAHQHPGGDGFRHLGKRSPGRGAAGLDGHEHVVARVPVGDGEDVEVVDFLAVEAQPCGAAADEVQV